MIPLFVIAAGIVAIAIGTLLLRSYGPRVRVSADGAVQMTGGTGRPLVVCTLEREEAMRVLAAGARARPIAAAVALAGGMALLIAGIGWALVAGAAA